MWRIILMGCKFSSVMPLLDGALLPRSIRPVRPGMLSLTENTFMLLTEKADCRLSPWRILNHRLAHSELLLLVMLEG